MSIFKKEQFKKLTGLEALDNLIDYGEWLPAYEMEIIREELRALEIIKSKCEFDFLEQKINDMSTKYEIHIRPKNKGQLLFTCLAISVKNKEQFNLLKEVLL